MKERRLSDKQENVKQIPPVAVKKKFNLCIIQVRTTVQITKHFNLIGGKLIAGDSTKFRAQNSKKNNFNPKKIDRHITYIDNKLDQYNKELASSEGQVKQEIKQEIEKHTNFWYI